MAMLKSGKVVSAQQVGGVAEESGAHGVALSGDRIRSRSRTPDVAVPLMESAIRIAPSITNTFTMKSPSHGSSAVLTVSESLVAATEGAIDSTRDGVTSMATRDSIEFNVNSI